MSLPYFIEYLFTLERPGGGRLCTGGLSQILIPAFPPNTTLNFRSAPKQNYYATIWFRFFFSPAVVPNAFTGWFQQYGSLLVSGTLTQLTTEYDLNYFNVVTEAQPNIMQITNVSGLVQYYEDITLFLNIPTREDYVLMMQELDKLRMSKLEGLASQANTLLKQLVQARPPTPSVRPS